MSLFSGEVPALGDATTVNGNKIQNVFHVQVPLSASSVNQTVFVPPVSYKVIGVTEVHGVVGGSGATVALEVIPSGTANGSGTAVLTTPVSLVTTVNTPQKGTLGTAVTIPVGARLGVVLAGTLTGLANCVIEITLVRV